eukprot:6970744-Prymnesium_polylepis.1
MKCEEAATAARRRRRAGAAAARGGAMGDAGRGGEVTCGRVGAAWVGTPYPGARSRGGMLPPG